mmetsp:Transcript_45756/g.103317  ORF Transcript_45756/g.103317 Transcript_45756/m.103317 type:complete len:216 (+) Transcript_45756:62-709(+)
MDRGGWGARTGHGMQVTLHVYDLSEVNEWAQHIGLGLYHTGVVIGMKEYTFAGGAGVFDHTPREPGDQAKFRESIAMGFFEGGQPQLHEALSALSKQFRPDAYSIVGNNCNHFADALCRRLVQQPIPGHINRLANFGGCFTACIPQQLLAGPPVGGQASGNLPEPSSYQAFTGSGMTLGASSEDRSTSSLPGSENLSDRRERMRQARLARLGGDK